ncbi:hypothetical protein [Desnuesiella massiliensis]|uniref:hypothetical protein n=1 Tax=Desnuesiella massiliensis TaxID=1650662 RepID=UPI0006E348BF|nr:hypothetical protein [Desnuesiella massiliensis]
MFKKHMFVSLLSIVIIFSQLGLVAKAYEGFSVYDKYFFYSGAQATKAKECFDYVGYNTPIPSDEPFTKANLMEHIPSLHCFYYSGHGSQPTTVTSKIFTGYNGTEAAITDAEIKAKAYGYYKFVFIDACSVGANKYMASAFGITNDDGLNHAFLGWTTAIYDTPSQYKFTQSVLENLTIYNKNLNDSVWAAYTESGCSNYKIYGKWNMTMSPHN